MYNILVCDDDKEIVEAIEIYLSQEGYHILKAYESAHGRPPQSQKRVAYELRPNSYQIIIAQKLSFYHFF